MALLAEYGTWKSPITSDLIVAGTIGLSSPLFHGEDIYWLESRPLEGGRNVIVRQSPNGETEDVTPPPFNVRSRVHEYGGGAFTVYKDTVYFTNFRDQRVYCQKRGETPQPLTPENQLRYADFCVDAYRNRLICVAEAHSPSSPQPENFIIAISLDKGEITTLIKGANFYSSPRISPDGSQLAWLEWNHPHMPWDSTRLCLGEINRQGGVENIRIIAGGEKESICQPEFSPQGVLYFSSDRSQWWNLYSWQQEVVKAVYPLEAEIGYPHWVFGESVYGFSHEGEIICAYTQKGCWYLAKIDLSKPQFYPITLPFTTIDYLRVRDKEVLFIGSAPHQPSAIVKMDLVQGGYKILKQSSNLEIDEGYISTPQAIEFPTSNGKTAYAWYYPPKNKDFQAPEGTKPPLLVKIHGGPTAMTSPAYNLRIQYWTSRGFALVDVNYGGSTGYGREYRERLYGQWGIVDVEDCVNAAKYLVKEGLVDGEKLAISGSSAGGYTTLAALTFHDTFKAGASYYGISDLEILAQDTHKFESHYLDKLIGKYPEAKEVYRARSPLYHIDRLSCPVIFFQGLEDKIVPPSQAERMYQALKQKGIYTEYITFPDEQHGFRKAENIKKALDKEYEFYVRVFGLPLKQ